MKAYPFGRGALIACTILFLTTCKTGQTDQQEVDPAFAEFVSAFTSGVISSGSSITISLTKDVVEFSQVGESADASLFSFSPSVKGMAIWQDRRTIRFKPDARFASGTSFAISFQLSSVTQVPKELSTFIFWVQTIPQNYELTIDNIHPYMRTDLARQKIEATLSTADFAGSAEAEKVITARQGNKNLKISWTHSEDGKTHVLVVEDVVRSEKAANVTLSLTGASLGIDRAEDINVDIPGLSDFKVTQVRVEPGNTPHVVIQFSDPLNEKQILEGIISLGNARGLSFEVADNLIHVYATGKPVGAQWLVIEAGVQNVLNFKLKEALRYELVFEPIKPEVRFTTKGNILPGTDGLVLPFEAVNLKAVELRVVRVYEPNILQFLQVNDLDGSSELKRVGHPVLQQTIRLDNSGISDLGKWNRFTLDLSSLFKVEPGAIYQVKLDVRRSHAIFPCGDTLLLEEEPLRPSGDWSGQNSSAYGSEYEYEYDYSDDYYNYSPGYVWKERDNPCHVSYYTSERSIWRNVIASDLGMLSKRGSDGNTLVFVNDLKTTSPMSGVDVELFDYQQQSIGSGKTGSDGQLAIATSKPPVFVVAKTGTQRGYLKVNDGDALSLSNFNVSGEKIASGLKGFLYGDRGVWRPGDSLYLSFILESKARKLPDNHPVVFELEDPNGVVTTRSVRSNSINGFYTFPCATAADAITGEWIARAKVGPATFRKNLRIETVKPNRLKINLDLGRTKITAADPDVSGTLKVSWLQGNPGRNLKAEFDLLLSRKETRFEKYPDYHFDDPTSNFVAEDQRIFEVTTNDEGVADVDFSIEVESGAPGILNATFRGKVFEDGGNYSLDRFTIPYYPYTSFVGVRAPPGDRWGWLARDTTHKADIVTVDAEGNPISRDNVRVSLHKLKWRWWWDASDGEANFMEEYIEEDVSDGNIRTVNGKGSWNFRVNRPGWGRYLLRVKDMTSGHTTGSVFYIGWAGIQQEGRDGATMLSFNADKETYSTGEKIKLTVPGSNNGRALVSVENGSKVLETKWVDMKAGDNAVELDAKPEMTPNCFVHVTLLQPHAQTNNDLPIRMYGVIPIRVEDPQTHLSPTIAMPDVLEPGQEVSIRVGESANRKMTYTIAVVEDGLLDLTRFKTPNAWSYFYAREALGVKTWDVYNEVMGAFGVERLLAVGGDTEIAGKEGDKKNNRFKPVVKFMGPFTLEGGTNNHKFTMPSYIGSVRTMIVAGYNGAYGLAEKTTPVRKPLMVLATLPRVLGPDEKLKLPVTIFRMDPGIREVKIEVSAEGPVTIVGQTTQSVSMTADDLTTEFDLSVKSETGVAHFIIKASSGKASATDDVTISVRNPNLPITKVTDGLLENGKSWTSPVVPAGLPGTNASVLEISTLPPINLGERLEYLITYPYGCIEQTTSSVFPQLYLDRLVPMNVTRKSEMSANITAAIQRIKSFMTADGGMAYWPGGDDADSWATSYAGHFLAEAETRGYFVPVEMMRKWKSHQRSKAQAWRRSQEYSNEIIQAYRLFTLANAGDPDLGAMNRMKEISNLPSQAAWMLAAAYARAGQKEAAKQYIAKLPYTIKPYREMAYSYGSDLRDKAIILETLVLLDDRVKGTDIVKEISASLSSRSWYSTQTLAWCLKSVAAFAGAATQGPSGFSYSYKGKEENVQSDLPVVQVDLPVEAKGDATLKLTSNTNGTLFVRTITRGTPAKDQEEAVENNISLSVSFTDRNGAIIEPSALEQGSSVIAVVTVTNPGLRGPYKNLALHHVFPSGWEVVNLRLADSEEAIKTDGFSYQDIRDDRVYTYFDLTPSQKKTFRYMVTASFAGTYYLPGVRVEAMYDQSISARTKGKEVTVYGKSSE